VSFRHCHFESDFLGTFEMFLIYGVDVEIEDRMRWIPCESSTE